MAPLRIIIAGAPASGKGTQCELIVKKYGVVHISTGDALREQVAAGTELGIKAKECMDQGALVPDDLIINIVKDRLAQDDCQERGWLLDGFPRTGVQAEALKAAGITPSHFILLDVPDSILVERCVGRRSDPVTGKIYHLKFNPPPDDPEIQGRLVHRSDDTEEAMGKRIKMYHQNVDAIIGFYKDISKNFDGTVDKNAIAAEIGYFLEGKQKPLQIVIAGAPASGKGTQCELIVQKFGVVHISTGDALREQVAAGTELGVKAKECMDAGALVPDDLIISIVKDRLAQDDCRERGWLLDGFPRTGVQAEALKAAGIEASHFILLDVPDSILVERCVGRRSDPVTGRIYHLKFNPPPDDPEVQGRLVHRSDDTAEAMEKRIKMYHQNVDAIIGFYKHIAKNFDGTADKHAIADAVAEFLQSKAGAAEDAAAAAAAAPASAAAADAPSSSAAAAAAEAAPPRAPLRIIIAGAPASGKGTQCELIVKKYGVVHLSTGDALREQVAAGTALGAQAKECMDAGALVPDDLIISIVKARLAQDDCKAKGWLLDGFPRTGAQAEALQSAGIEPTHFVLLDVPDSILVERCVGRRSDPVTGRIYHLKFNPPPADPEVQGRLVHRSDDTAEAMGKRIKMYHDNVDAIIGFYGGICRRVDGTVDKGAIAERVSACLDGRPAPPAAGPGGPRRLIIAGPPASGKGTQCEGLAREFGVVHISTGDELREHVRQGTELGRQAKAHMDAGGLVPDDLMVRVVRARLGHQDCADRGWLLDGFPRTGGQVRALREAGIEPSHFILLDVPDSILVERCVGRRSDPVTGRIYHLTLNPPPQDPDVLARLVQRSDDTAEAMGKRIQMYHANLSSVLAYYEDVARRINGYRDKGAVLSEAIAFVRGEVPPGMSGAAPRRPLPGPDAAAAYVQARLQPFLVDALKALVKAKPEKPLLYLANWMIEHNPSRPAVKEDVPARTAPPPGPPPPRAGKLDTREERH